MSLALVVVRSKGGRRVRDLVGALEGSATGPGVGEALGPRAPREAAGGDGDDAAVRDRPSVRRNEPLQDDSELRLSVIMLIACIMLAFI